MRFIGIIIILSHWLRGCCNHGNRVLTDSSGPVLQHLQCQKERSWEWNTRHEEVTVAQANNNATAKANAKLIPTNSIYIVNTIDFTSTHCILS